MMVGKLIEGLILEAESWREKYLKECDLWEEVEKHNRELCGEWAALLIDRDDWKAKLAESEASRKKLKDGVTSLAQLYTEALLKIRVRCPSCQRFLDRTGRCDFCAKKEPVVIYHNETDKPVVITGIDLSQNPPKAIVKQLDHPDSKGATIERWLP